MRDKPQTAGGREPLKRLNYELSFDGAVLSAGLATHDAGLDAAHQRDAWNRRVLPARHMRGRVREALEEMVASYLVGRDEHAGSCAYATVAYLFGNGGASSANGPAVRSILAFSDAVEGRNKTYEHGLVPLTEAHLAPQGVARATGLEIRHRVTIDRHTGTALPSHLGMAEASELGAVRTFRGSVDFPERGVPGLRPDEIFGLLGWALRWLRCVGRTTQSGWGRITKRSIDPSPQDDLRNLLEKLLAAAAPTNPAVPVEAEFSPRTPASSTQKSTSTIDFAIVLDEPLVIGDRSPMANVVESRTDVPGSVIRRAIADVLLMAARRRPGGWVGDSLASELDDPGDKRVADRFEEIESSFAHWVEPGTEHRLLPTPPTVTKDDRELLREHIAAVSDSDEKGRSEGLQCVVEARRSKALRRTQQGPPLSLRTHVAKSRASGGGSEGNLFSVRAISPRSESSSVQHTRLDAWLRCPAELVDDVQRVLGRVRRLGKSSKQGYGAVRIYRVDRVEDRWKKRLTDWNSGRTEAIEIPILLVTEALLLNPEQISLGDDLRPHYQKLFVNQLGVEASRLTLPYCCVRHRLYGGATARGIGATPPAVLTKAGSLWVLRLSGYTVEEAIRALEPLVAQGGLVNDAALAQVETSWGRMAPTTIANGYGEICIAHKPPHQSSEESHA